MENYHEEYVKSKLRTKKDQLRNVESNVVTVAYKEV